LLLLQVDMGPIVGSQPATWSVQGHFAVLKPKVNDFYNEKANVHSNTSDNAG
jgi:hypothetical protein